MNKKKKLIMIGLVLFSISIITLGTYALYNTALITGDASISSGEVKMSYSEKNEITLSNALPIKDDEGKLSTNYFDFSIMTYIKTNASDSTEYKMNYNIVLEPLTTTNPLSDSEIKVYLTKVENGVETAVVEPTTVDKLIQYIINSQEETFSNNKSEVVTNYRLRAWIDYDVDVTKFNEKTYSYKFRVNVNNEEVPLTALVFAKSKVGTDGLETVTHTIDSTLQVGSEFATEYRYRGGDSTVKNYVTFNNETWRIIGILPTEDTDGNVEYRFKIIRNESIGSYVWNGCTTSDYEKCDDTGKYLNDWTEASLNTYLNGDYYNNLSSEVQSMIGTAKYYLGGYLSSDITSDTMWQYERKKTNGSDCALDEYGQIGLESYFFKTNPVVQSDVSKKIALMYVSDYGYAALTSCSKTLSTYDDDTNCITTNNWLDKSQDEWILPQRSRNSYDAFSVWSSGKVFFNPDSVHYNQFAVRPVLSLSSNVKISGGSGTSSNPYTLSL